MVYFRALMQNVEAALTLAREYMGSLSKSHMTGTEAMRLSHAINMMQMRAAPTIKEVKITICSHSEAKTKTPGHPGSYLGTVPGRPGLQCQPGGPQHLGQDRSHPRRLGLLPGHAHELRQVEGNSNAESQNNKPLTQSQHPPSPSAPRC